MIEYSIQLEELFNLNKVMSVKNMIFYQTFGKKFRDFVRRKHVFHVVHLTKNTFIALGGLVEKWFLTMNQLKS